MLRRETPKSWRRGYSLYRRKLREDSYGEQEAYFDMENPDVTAEDGSADGVCWQPFRGWQSGGQTNDGFRREEQGETEEVSLQGAIFSDVEMNPSDRLAVDGAVYELYRAQQWPGHRMLQLRLLYPAKQEEETT